MSDEIEIVEQRPANGAACYALKNESRSYGGSKYIAHAYVRRVRGTIDVYLSRDADLPLDALAKAVKRLTAPGGVRKPVVRLRVSTI